MATIKKFEDIEAWKVARDLCRTISAIIDSGSFKSNFRLIGQIEGSSGSIMDNIAEGFERGTRSEFIQFLGYSKGSWGELRSHIYRALDSSYISKDQFDELYQMAVRISAMLQKLIEYLLQTKVKVVRKKEPLNP